MATQEAPAKDAPPQQNLMDQFQSILMHPEFPPYLQTLIGNSPKGLPEDQTAKSSKSDQPQEKPHMQYEDLSPEDQKKIDAFIEDYHNQVLHRPLTPDFPLNSDGKPSIADSLLNFAKSYGNAYGPLADKRNKTAGNLLNNLFGFPFPTPTPLIPGMKNSLSDTPQDQLASDQEGPKEQAAKTEEPEGPAAPTTLPDQGQDYSALAKELGGKISEVNTNIDVADQAANQAKAQMLGAYNKLVPTEPVTPFSVLGDLVRIGASFAMNKNPGLAIALANAGQAIKGYDPAIRQFRARQSFAKNLFEGLSAVDIKRLEDKLQAPDEIRRLQTQVKLAGIQEKGQNVRAQFHETSENVRARQAADERLQAMGIKTGHEDLMNQVTGLVNDMPFIRDQLENGAASKTPYDEYPLRERIHVALGNVINLRHPRENFNSAAVTAAEDELYRKLSKEIKK